ncbi:tRNA dimethylallyltransferase [Virgibacillus subterraneus]|uniref:tRNA dimethylallyltransferase n=2 Tax=Virgibacillus subterraneus TaxID=621109 RepID=A0A1H9H0I8_9BACI|nr:tRNA dimethylallyltransferase [Virgibacillus subterraneus]
MMKKPVIAIVGPTAVGKTRLSIEVAESFNGEIISGDSMQVYQGLDIGTAKISEEEKQGIPHYMIDTKSPSDSFSVADYQVLVQQYINEIASHQKLPIIAGGSGLYIQAALYNYNFSDQKRNGAVTRRLEEELENLGVLTLYNRLKKIDPDQATKIHPNNHRRVIRALEIYQTTGMTMSEYQKEQKRDSPYNPIFIGLEMDRKLLYERINARVDNMLEQGLLDEVEMLYKQGFENCQSMRGIGYKEFIPYFKGEQSLIQATETLKRNSRRFAKRQYTWFKNKLDVQWYTITPETIDETFRKILDELAGMLRRI